VHQIAANLITNAVHAVGERGQIEVRIDSARSSRGPRARLRVRDDGMGMDARTRERLFDPYFSTKEPGRGTGLGLPIVHSVVTSLGDRIDVDSQPGRGTTFTVLLPEIEPPAGITASTEAVLPDDEPSVRRVATRLLESLSCLVIGAANAGDALAHARRAADSFDVLVTDYRMPGGSGTELVAAIRREAGPLPAVLISGHLDDATDDGPLPSDIVLLAKPFTREALAQALTTAPYSPNPSTGPRTPDHRSATAGTPPRTMAAWLR
jgi:CheY-like chemotaxis protein/anti-sigma regulatory factor (Ser/Thr protein kinase)